MSAVVSEIISSRKISGTPGQDDYNVELAYVVNNTDSDSAALAALLSAAPATYSSNSQTLRRDSIELYPEYVNTSGPTGIWFAKVKYITQAAWSTRTSIRKRMEDIGTEPPRDAEPELRRSFEAAPVTVNRPYSLQTVSTFGTDAPNLKGAIELDEQGIRGADIQVAQQSFTIEKIYSSTDFLANRNTWARWATPAHVNAQAYEGFAAGEVLYQGFTAQDEFEYDQETDTLTVTYRVTFRFAVQFNATPDINGNSLPDGATLTEKQGWDYLWIYRSRAEGDPPDTATPKGAYYEKVYPRADFDTDIGLPGIHP